MKQTFLSILLGMLFALPTFAQDNESQPEKYRFTTIKSNPITSIKDQNQTGTCWSFSGLAFLESEVIRLTGKQVDLSPMFVASHSYKDKARQFIRTHGFTNFAQGGSFYDVLYVLQNYGIVPMSEMDGLKYGSKKHNHNELEAVAFAFVKALQKEAEKAHGFSTAWHKAFDGIIDSYLGEAPKQFTYEGKSYTPRTFTSSLKINPADYVSLTSYTHHPFYSTFALEIPDNWRMGISYNLPIDELMEVFDYAIDNGYTVAWGADVSDIGFTRHGLGVLVDTNVAESTRGSDMERWIGSNNKPKYSPMDMAAIPGAPEREVTQETRQKNFDNYDLTDDHGMQIFGKAQDQTGKKFFMVKNSWGEVGDYKGIWYVSERFVKGKTMNIVVHKDAVPKSIRKKLGF